jgi:hypothetical protein
MRAADWRSGLESVFFRSHHGRSLRAQPGQCGGRLFGHLLDHVPTDRRGGVRPLLALPKPS